MSAWLTAHVTHSIILFLLCGPAARFCILAHRLCLVRSAQPSRAFHSLVLLSRSRSSLVTHTIAGQHSHRAAQRVRMDELDDLAEAYFSIGRYYITIHYNS